MNATGNNLAVLTVTGVVTACGWWENAETGQRMFWAFVRLPGGTVHRFRCLNAVLSVGNREMTLEELRAALPGFKTWGLTATVIGGSSVIHRCVLTANPAGGENWWDGYKPDYQKIDNSRWNL